MKNSPDIGTVIGNKTSEGSSIKISSPEMTNFNEKKKKKVKSWRSSSVPISDFSRRKIGKRKIEIEIEIEIKIESNRTARESGRAGEREENKWRSSKLLGFRARFKAAYMGCYNSLSCFSL